jgi:hypothetical protein
MRTIVCLSNGGGVRVYERFVVFGCGRDSQHPRKSRRTREIVL